jgi:hypothetical protein
MPGPPVFPADADSTKAAPARAQKSAWRHANFMLSYSSAIESSWRDSMERAARSI